MPTVLDTFLDVLQPGVCDGCPDHQTRRVYTDPETGCRYCLDCLVIAIEPEIELPEDAFIIATGRSVIAELISARR